jgi:hypothetical protein
MRSLHFATEAAIGLAAASLLVGCNAIFGLDEVALQDPVDGGGGSGGGKSCPSATIEKNLLLNPSFEKSTDWTPAGQAAVFDYVPADDCSFACGSRVGHVAVKADGGTGSIGLYQTVNKAIELGGTFALSARYRYTATNAPYFTVNVNGYDVGTQFIYGMAEGEHLVIDKLEVPVLDPRRTGERVRVGLSADYDGAGLDASVDCLALTYTPPPGEQVLKNGWFDGSTGFWSGSNQATMTWEAAGGLCSSGVAHVKVPANADSAEIRATTVTGSWPAGTTFHFGGAVKPLEDAGGILSVLNFSGTLFLVYKDDGDSTTSEIDNFAVPAMADSQEWKRISGEFVAVRPVTDVSFWIGGGSSSMPGEFLADCASVRAVLPSP